MLADRITRRRPLSSVVVSACLALALGLAGAMVGAATASPAAETAPVNLAIVVPIVVPTTTTGLLDADAVARYTAPQGLLTRELDSVIGRPVSIGIDPAIIASIRLLGSSAPPSALAWLDRLASATNDSFALAYADADITLITQAGGAAPLAPVPLDFAIDPTLFAPAVVGAPKPPSTATEKPALPSGTSVLEWNYTLTHVAWPRANTVSSSDVAALAAAGYSTAILSSGNLSGTGATAELGGIRAVVADDPVSIALQAAVSAPNDGEWSGDMVALKSAIASAGQTASTLVATLGRSAPLTTNRLAQTLDDLGVPAANSSAAPTAPLVSAQPLSVVLAAGGATAGTVSVRDQSHDAADVASAAQVLASADADASFATVAKDPAAITGPSRLSMLALLSNQWSSTTTGRATAISEYLSAGVDLRSSIEVLKTSGVNLLADRASLPITVENRLNQVVTVYISVRPETALLAVGDGSVELTIEPNSQGKAQIPVQAISNGTVALTVTLASANGATIGSPVHTTINVQAGWETPVVVVIAVLVVLLFAGGLVRSIVKRRRAQGD